MLGLDLIHNLEVSSGLKIAWLMTQLIHSLKNKQASKIKIDSIRLVSLALVFGHREVLEDLHYISSGTHLQVIS